MKVLLLCGMTFLSFAASAGLVTAKKQDSKTNQISYMKWNGGFNLWDKHSVNAKPNSMYSRRQNKNPTSFFDETIIGTTRVFKGTYPGICHITNIYLTGSPDYSLDTDCLSSSINGCRMDIHYSPTTVGPSTTTLNIRRECPNPPPMPPTVVNDSASMPGAGIKFEKAPECSNEVAGSILRVESKSVSEKVNIVGTDFDLFYSTNHSLEYITPFFHPVRQANFNPEGWTVSVIHHYDSATNHLFLGTGEMLVRKSITNSNQKLVVNEDDVFIFDSTGKHLETRSALTGYLKFTFEYNQQDKITKITDSFGHETSFDRDTAGILTSIESHFGKITNIQVNTDGLINEITNPNLESFKITYVPGSDLIETFKKPGGHTTTFAFMPNGWIGSDQGSGGNLWDFSYNFEPSEPPMTDQYSQMGRLTTYYGERQEGTNSYVSKVFSPFGFETNYTENADLSYSTSNVFESSTSTSQHDERFGDALSRTSTVTEVINGLTRFTEFLKTVTLSDPNDPFSYSQLISTTKVNGVPTINTFNKSTLTSSTVDPMGITSITTLDNFERPISIKHGNDVPVSISYNTLGKIEQTTQNGTNTTSYSYNSNGEVATVTNALNQTTSYLYDDAGRATRITYPDGRFLRYRYNSDGKITAIYPPSRPAHVFAFNALELPSVYRPPMIPETTTPQTRYYYNLDKQLTVIKRPDGKTVRYNYEPEIGLLMSMVLGPNERQTYSYQELTGKPRVIHSPDQVRSAFTYFGMDQIASEQQTIGGTTTKMIHGFDNFFRANRRIIQVDGTEVGRVVTAFRDDNKPIRVGEMRFTYDSTSGRLVSTILDKVRDRRTYDSFGNLKSYQATYHPEGGAAQELYFYTLTRDTLHRIVTKIERVQGVRTSFEYSYDSVGRLSSVTKNGVVDSSFTYDANSNRISGTQNGQAFTATYDSQDRLLTYTQGSEVPKQFTYNLNGELTQIEQGTEITTLVPDSLGRLKSVTLPDNTAITYKLDWTGRRSARSVNGVQVVRSVFENDYQLAAEFDASNNLREYVSYTNVNSSDYFKQGSDLYRIIKDHLGSPRLVVKADDASVAQKMDYNEWGKVIVDTNPGFQPFGFAGGLYDKDTKLVKFGARDYDGNVGRWLTKDPIRFEGGDTNLYGYVVQDPVNFTDPTGNIKLVTPATPVTSFLSVATGGPECLNEGHKKELESMKQEKKLQEFLNKHKAQLPPVQSKPSDVIVIRDPNVPVIRQGQ